MTEKRFTMKGSTILENNEEITAWDCCDLLNELHEENEQLKQAYTQLEHRHSLLHDECIDAECDRDSYRKDIVSLEKENEQLKQQNKEFIELIRHCYENWSEEKKKMVGEISNGLLGDMND